MDLVARFYPEAAAGGFTRVDGSVEFYTRVRALVGPDSQVLDFGAGRGWALTTTRWPPGAGWPDCGARWPGSSASTSTPPSWTTRLQPDRKGADVFPTAYRMNTRRALARWFDPARFRHVVYPWDAEPAYAGRSQLLWLLLWAWARVAPTPLHAVWLVFLQKRGDVPWGGAGTVNGTRSPRRRGWDRLHFRR